MIGEFGKTLPLPRLVFVGEPSNMTVVDAHKGPVRWRVELTGRAAHSSMPHLGVNAIAYAGRLIGEILAMEEELKAGPLNPRFDPPWTTTQVTQIEGGTASNVVPVPCWFGWETRALPGFDPFTLQRRLEKFAAEVCLPEMRKLAPESKIEVRVMNHVTAYAADTKSGIVPLALKLAGQNETFAVSYCTEAGLFQDGGAPAIICGPGDIAQAHTVNEFVRIEELDKCLTFLGRLADWAEA
jgi:acetylornithine deacetylase